MNPEEKLRFLLGLEKAEHKVSEADSMLSGAKADLRNVVIQSLGLDPTVDDIDNLRAQVAVAVLLVVQADRVVKATEAIVSTANEAVEIARQMHLIASPNREGRQNET